MVEVLANKIAFMRFKVIKLGESQYSIICMDLLFCQGSDRGVLNKFYLEVKKYTFPRRSEGTRKSISSKKADCYMLVLIYLDSWVWQK